MIKCDGKGRIKYIDDKPSPGQAISGDSVCNACGKDMPVCWEVVCKECYKTFCYNHVRLIDHSWICWDHEPTGRS